MAKISFMSRLTLGIIVALILFGVIFTFTMGLTTAVNGIAAHYAPDASAPFPQPFWELLLSFAVAFIPIAIVVWDHQAATKAEPETQAPRQLGTWDSNPQISSPFFGRLHACIHAGFPQTFY